MRRLLDVFARVRAPVLREARAADIPQLAKMHAAAFRRGWGRDEFERLLSDKAVRAHVASERAQACAFVLSHVVAPEAEILSIAVRADRRGRGHGRALLKHHLSRLASEGVTISFLEVDEANRPALGLYRSFGYDVVGRRKGYYGEGGKDALLLRRDF